MKKRSHLTKLVSPSLQLKLIGSFAGLSALSLLLQFVLLSMRISQLSARMPEGGDFLAEQAPGVLFGILVFSFTALLPITFAVGVIITFRIAGPIHHFEQHLEQVLRGEDSAPCSIREKDELQRLCVLINQAIAAARQQGTAAGSRAAPPPADHVVAAVSGEQAA
jgi:hypothetical protein